MAKYNNQKVEFDFYIQQEGGVQNFITNLTDPAPTIFEDLTSVEIRFNVLLEDQASFLKYHALNQYEGQSITVGLVYPNGVELKSTFKVEHYERRFGSNKGAIVTHVFKGDK